jgi:DNA-binding IclR family transcriptional regulator
VEKAFRVENFLASGDVLEWRSAADVAAGALVSKNEAYRILKTMVSCGRAEQNDKGFRIHRGIVQHAIYVQEYMARQVRRLGVGGV